MFTERLQRGPPTAAEEAFVNKPARNAGYTLIRFLLASRLAQRRQFPTLPPEVKCQNKKRGAKNTNLKPLCHQLKSKH